MPLPSPRKGQSRSQFVSECMGDDVAVKEFPDQKQRAAVCYSRWRESKSKAAFSMEIGDDEYVYFDEEKED